MRSAVARRSYERSRVVVVPQEVLALREKQGAVGTTDCE
jgi:hypothetical protein